MLHLNEFEFWPHFSWVTVSLKLNFDIRQTKTITKLAITFTVKLSSTARHMIIFYSPVTE